MDFYNKFSIDGVLLNNRSFASQSTSAGFAANQRPLLKLLHLDAEEVACGFVVS
jgi:hypothetical protein